MRIWGFVLPQRRLLAAAGALLAGYVVIKHNFEIRLLLYGKPHSDPPSKIAGWLVGPGGEGGGGIRPIKYNYLASPERFCLLKNKHI